LASRRSKKNNVCREDGSCGLDEFKKCRNQKRITRDMTNRNVAGSMREGPDESIIKCMISVLHSRFTPFEKMRREMMNAYPEMEFTLEQMNSLDEYINNISQISPEYTTHMYLVNLNYKMISVERKLDEINASILEQSLRNVNVQTEIRELKEMVKNVLRDLTARIRETNNIMNRKCSEIQNSVINLTNIVVRLQERGGGEVLVREPNESNEQALTLLREEINNLVMFIMDFENFLSNWKREQEEFWDRYFVELSKSLLKDIGKEISLRFIGDSYYNWSSITSFYPTLIFLFVETGVSSYARRSQIKVRLNKEHNEVTEEDVLRLKEFSEEYNRLEYTHGIHRANYVSNRKNFKTVVFGNDREEVVKILNKISMIAEEPFDRSNITFTEGLRSTTKFRRNIPLGDEPVVIQRARSTFHVECTKVVLMVRGLEKPITIWYKEREDE
jgi:hypothetical protein